MNNLKINYYQCGTIVTICISKIEGMITGVNLRFDSISYEITYFHDGEHKTVWLREQEFTTEGIKKIGYLK